MCSSCTPIPHVHTQADKGFKLSPIFQTETTVLSLCEPETVHLFMIKHQERVSLPGNHLFSRVARTPRCPPLGVGFPWHGLHAERARETSLLECVYCQRWPRAVDAPGRGPRSVPSAGEEGSRTHVGGQGPRSVGSPGQGCRASPLPPSCFAPGWSLHIENSVLCLIQRTEQNLQYLTGFPMFFAILQDTN